MFQEPVSFPRGVPFCRECGKDVQATWKVCPHCAAPQSVENSTQSTDVSLSDSVIGGDVTINQNNPEEIAAAMVSALERLGFSDQGQPESLDEAQQNEVKDILKLSDSLERQGIQLSPQIELDLGRASQTVGNHDNTQNHFNRALESAIQINDFRLISQAYSGLVNVSIRTGDGEAALNYSKANKDAAIQSGDMFEICNAMLSQGRAELKLGQHTEGINTLMQALQIARQQNQDFQVAAILGNLANHYRQMKQYKLAVDAASESLQLFKKFTSIIDICRLTYSCGLINMETGHYHLCEEQLREALTLAQSCGNREMQSSCWVDLGNLYRVHYQLHDQANEYYRNYVSIHRELGNPDNQWIIENKF